MRTHGRDESGFTLIELLVVILIIGVLAAIALPALLGQRQKAQDSSAKSAVRNAVSQVESCLVDVPEVSPADCGLTHPSVAATINASAGGGTADVTSPGFYELTARSVTGNTFTIKKTAGRTSRFCSSGGFGAGGCDGSSW